MTLKELSQVVKDFNNSWTKDLVEESNTFCYKIVVRGKDV